MLADAEIVSLIPSFKHDEARAFYVEILGFELTHEDGFGMAFNVGGRTLRRSKVREAYTPYPFSVLGIRVDDIDGEMKVLAEKGVTFEGYDALEQDARGVWQVQGGGPRLAWFKDPDGNLLGLVSSME
jgi:catechol 2,3-dioxygenase-like lactoylglutathione lyase family enzyme